MFIRRSKHAAMMKLLEEERLALAARNEMLESSNRQLNLEVLALRAFIAAEGLHQRHCDTLAGKPCDCRLSRAGMPSPGLPR